MHILVYVQWVLNQGPSTFGFRSVMPSHRAYTSERELVKQQQSEASDCYSAVDLDEVSGRAKVRLPLT